MLLGTLGGIGLLIGPAGLLWLKARRDPALADADADRNGRRRSWCCSSLVERSPGLLLLALRETARDGRAARACIWAR